MSVFAVAVCRTCGVIHFSMVDDETGAEAHLLVTEARGLAAMLSAAADKLEATIASSDPIVPCQGQA